LHPEEGLVYPTNKGYSLPNRFFHGAGQESFQGKGLEPEILARVAALCRF
jgi:hypothetical protein